MDPLGIACNWQEPPPVLTNCSAQIGEPCNWYDEVTGEKCHIIGRYHDCRISEATGQEQDFSPSIVDKAVDSMGID